MNKDTLVRLMNEFEEIECDVIEQSVPHKKLHMNRQVNALLILHNLSANRNKILMESSRDVVWIGDFIDNLLPVLTEQVLFDLFICGVRYKENESHFHFDL